jgi:hypothetical protein
MICHHCESARKSFTSEIAIHFPGLGGLNKPVVWVFPEVKVCLNCGTAEFVVPGNELRALVDGKQDDAIAS